MARKSGAISKKSLARYRKHFESEPRYRVAMNAATHGHLEEIALSRRVVDGLDWHFSHELSPGGITAQKSAGTCWIYAGLNWLRKLTMKRMGVEEFYFSQNYLVFWDKLEKANRFLERMIDLRDRPIDDRKVHHYLQAPVSDGGDWLLLANLIDKYGLVPREAMADTSNLGDSAFMNKVMSFKLRQGAADLRRLHADGASIAELHAVKEAQLGAIHRMLCILLGEPPETFDLAYRTKGGKFHRRRGLTPHQLFQEWVGIETSDYYHLVSSPMESTPYDHTYVVENLRNIEGMPPGPSLNVPIDTVRELAVKLLKKGEPVFFDCDVTQGLNRALGVLDNDLFEYDLLFDTSFEWERPERMAYLHQRPTHCMVLIGVDLVNGRPAKWKIENSWGDELGHKGLFQMSDEWFEEHVYGLTVHRSHLGKKLRKLFDQEPVALPPWHTLA
jgi:bleomycin hydrolase